VAGAETPVCLHVVPGCFDALLRATDVQSFADVAALPLVSGAARAGDGVKRVLDAAFAVVSLLVLGLPMLLVGALIRLTSAGGAIYRQERVGRGGRVFIVYKFRTMVDGAESGTGPVLAAGDGDSRLTPLGRFLRNHRIDELPQLINVLKGDMSLVGPRPERPVFVERFCREIPGYALRHRVRPGITGLAQVCGDYHTHPRDKLRFDLIYIGQRSLWLDLVILWRTVRVCLRRGE
jgi:lipopolysaccharide/colanic/teichoic acid biosynthesis glycosyltransferase